MARRMATVMAGRAALMAAMTGRTAIASDGAGAFRDG